MFLDLRQRYLDGDLARGAYVGEPGQLADTCRAAGLLPLSTRGG